MRRRDFIKVITGSAVTWPLAARAQQGGRKYVIGRFAAGSATLESDALTDALRQLGWVEGENVVFERRYAENRLERLPEMAADLVQLKVDLITQVELSRHSRPSGQPRPFQSSW
jgi:putative ABC transport system substrate-binding protein